PGKVAMSRISIDMNEIITETASETMPIIPPGDWRAEAEAFLQSDNGAEPDAGDEFRSAVIVKPANVWIDEARMRPIPEKLFDGFIFEHEITVLFGDTGCGKSALAVQIGESAASGNQIPH